MTVNNNEMDNYRLGNMCLLEKNLIIILEIRDMLKK
jgi:hypothetical protein